MPTRARSGTRPGHAKPTVRCSGARIAAATRGQDVGGRGWAWACSESLLLCARAVFSPSTMHKRPAYHAATRARAHAAASGEGEGEGWRVRVRVNGEDGEEDENGKESIRAPDPPVQ